MLLLLTFQLYQFLLLLLLLLFLLLLPLLLMLLTFLLTLPQLTLLTFPGSDTSDRGCGRECSRGCGKERHRRSQSGSTPPVTFPNIPYSFSNSPLFLGNPQGPNFSLCSPRTAYTSFLLFLDDQLLQCIVNQTNVYDRMHGTPGYDMLHKIRPVLNSLYVKKYGAVQPWEETCGE